MTTVAGVEYGLLEETEFGAMTALLADVFSRREPPAVAVGLTAREITNLVSAFRKKALAERLTIVAREAPAGDLLGGLLVEDFGTPPPPGIDEAVPAFAPIGALLGGLDARYRESRSVAEGSHLHLFMLAVADRAAGRGIAHRLVAAALANGSRRGYRFAVTEATGRISQHVFRKLGFRDVLSAPYGTFLFEGRPVFASIVGHDATVLMEREL
ncbi:MAG TPA: GNAT family N-acetyltransferase [Thermoanaerobaculia bacterium]|nr:GNAT family N-acetyltransferase [Thermoanaerobaculia bacterium]